MISLLTHETLTFEIIPWNEETWNTLGKDCTDLYVINTTGNIYKINDWSHITNYKNGQRICSFNVQHKENEQTNWTFSISTGVMAGNTSYQLRFIHTKTKND
jgi:hypothetical protein